MDKKSELHDLIKKAILFKREVNCFGYAHFFLDKNQTNRDSKYPLIFIGDNRLFIYKEFEKSIMHRGPHAVLAAIRSKYWPKNKRNLNRKTVYKRVKGFRSKLTTVYSQWRKMAEFHFTKDFNKNKDQRLALN